MPTVLNQIPFSEELLPLVADFDCAQQTPANAWEDEINEWIRMDPAAGDGARYHLGKGTQVWLYTNEHNEVVGYGSLCASRWPDPAVLEQVPNLKRVPISLVPAVGINRQFQGGPPGAEPAEKYSTKIMNHLVFEARKHHERQPFLGLYVHPDNGKAIRLYRRLQFEPFRQKYRDPKTGVEYMSMILKLAAFPFGDE
jgi:GNAT superfamily N-acetyltransferase